MSVTVPLVQLLKLHVLLLITLMLLDGLGDVGVKLLAELADSIRPRGKRRGSIHILPEPSVQLPLFEMRGHPIIDQLRGLDITRLTPIEALTTLHRWQEMINNPES